MFLSITTHYFSVFALNRVYGICKTWTDLDYRRIGGYWEVIGFEDMRTMQTKLKDEKLIFSFPFFYKFLYLNYCLQEEQYATRALVLCMTECR